MPRAAFLLTVTVAALASAGCRDKTEKRIQAPLSLGLADCATTADAGAAGTLGLRVETGEAPGTLAPPTGASFFCAARLDGHLAATFRLRAEPAGAEILVDGARTDVVVIPLLPLVKDELMQHVSYWNQFAPLKDEVLARVRARATRKVEVRGADQTRTFELALDGYQLDDAAYAALVREAAKAPKSDAAPADTKKGVILQMADGQVVRAGRERITLGDFDWLATETETGRTTLKTCAYERGGSFPLLAVATKVVVTDRTGAVVAEKAQPGPTRAECPEHVFTIDGKGREGPMLTYPKTSAWLDELSAKVAR